MVNKCHQKKRISRKACERYQNLSEDEKEKIREKVKDRY